MVKRIGKWMLNLFVVFLLSIALISVFLSLQSKDEVPSLFGIQMLTVLTGSMEPYINAGDVIFIRSTESIQENDVITFSNEQNNYVTHRVIDVITQDGTVFYQTKGDANNMPDQHYVTKEQVVGSLLIYIPKAGYVMSFLRSPSGIFLVVGIIAISFIYPLLVRGFSSRGKVKVEST